MEVDIRYEPLEFSKENFQRTLEIIKDTLPFDVGLSFPTYHDFDERKYEINQLYSELEIKSSLSHYPPTIVDEICKKLDDIIDNLTIMDFEAANILCDLRLRWQKSSPQPWFQKATILYQQFVLKHRDNLEEITDIFKHVVDLVETSGLHQDLGFWSYSYMANLYLYRILSGQKALEHAMKFYNQAYRFAQIHDIDVEDEFIFENVDILQQILMNKYPLLVLIYNDKGLKMYDYLFQFVEVMAEEQRFTPNFTALLSVVDDRIKSLFKSSIDNAYIVIENRLMIITTLFNTSNEEWIKIAFVFSYLDQSADDIEIDQSILNKISEFKTGILQNSEIMTYFKEFNGKYDDKIYDKIEKFIPQIFS